MELDRDYLEDLRKQIVTAGNTHLRNYHQTLGALGVVNDLITRIDHPAAPSEPGSNGKPEPEAVTGDEHLEPITFTRPDSPSALAGDGAAP